jgi:hypothetical protein
MNAAAETVKIEGVTYEVVKAETADSYEARGLMNLAAAMRENGIVRDLFIRRPNGRVVSMVVDNGGVFGKVLRVPGRW